MYLKDPSEKEENSRSFETNVVICNVTKGTPLSRVSNHTHMNEPTPPVHHSSSSSFAFFFYFCITEGRRLPTQG